jgi:hypothetical protein
MAVKIYNNSSKVVINDGTLIEDYSVSDLRYNVNGGTLILYNNNIEVRSYARSDVQNKTGGTYATDDLLSEYLSAFLSESTSTVILSTSNLYGVLGQLNPSAITLSTLYTVPSAKQIQELSGMVCNRSATATSFRIAIRPNGDAIDDKHYIYYDVAIGGNDTFYFDVRIRLSDTDVVSVYANDATLSFSVYGEEIDII